MYADVSAAHLRLFKMKNTTQYGQQAGVQMGLFTIALQWYSQSGYQGVKFQLLLIITHSTVAIVRMREN